MPSNNIVSLDDASRNYVYERTQRHFGGAVAVRYFNPLHVTGRLEVRQGKVNGADRWVAQPDGIRVQDVPSNKEVRFTAEVLSGTDRWIEFSPDVALTYGQLEAATCLVERDAAEWERAAVREVKPDLHLADQDEWKREGWDTPVRGSFGYRIVPVERVMKQHGLIDTSARPALAEIIRANVANTEGLSPAEREAQAIFAAQDFYGVLDGQDTDELYRLDGVDDDGTWTPLTPADTRRHPSGFGRSL